MRLSPGTGARFGAGLLAAVITTALAAPAAGGPPVAGASRSLRSDRRAFTPPPPPGPAGVRPPRVSATTSGIVAAPAPAAARSPWRRLAHPPPFNPGTMLLLTDGSVMVQDLGNGFGTRDWWRFKPDGKGSYVNGAWSRLASLPANYSPLYYASAVLPGGRVIIEGGEFNLGSQAETNLGAIYDPTTNRWTKVNPPSGPDWGTIGDAPSAVLANGQFMLGAAGTSVNTAQARLDGATLTWTATGSGKADANAEEGWSLLPDGKLLTVDTDNPAAPRKSERYNPATGAWTGAGNTPVALIDSVHETGPQLLRPDGTVLAVGATGHNAIYHSATATWTAGPEFPVIGGRQYHEADGPAAVLPNGHVLLDASPGLYETPSHFFDFDGTKLTQVADPDQADIQTSYYGLMLVLPSGGILFNNSIGELEVYTSRGTPQSSWRPRITAVPTTLARAGTYTLSGVQLNGLTQGSAYGDDYQSATNYPLVRITGPTGQVSYARTSGMTAMAVAPNWPSSATFRVPGGTGLGTNSLQVVANGIASAPVSVTITAAP